jgi:hypothetical protein
MKWKLPIVTAGLLAAVAAVAVLPGNGRAATSRKFVHDITNPWLPFKVGSRWVFRGSKDGKPTVEVVTVTNKRRTLAGVSCVEILDVLSSGGKPVERTHDWYVQDADGNVWYYGEATATYDAKGHVVSRKGSWLAGVNGAKPGIFMPGNPRIGVTHRQEYDRGRAEDMFTVAGLGTQVKVPYGSYTNALLTVEYTPIEPGSVDFKYYVRNVGVIYELSGLGPKDANALVSYTP